MHQPARKFLLVLLLVYAAASLLHFIHNAEFLADYPNLPATWSRAGVYLAWAVMTIVGMLGWFLVTRGHEVAGLLIVLVYAALGLDSLGHYVLAPMAMHSMAMNTTILREVSAAALVFAEASRLIVVRMLRQSSAGLER